MSECVFCLIKNGKRPASIVWQDEKCLAFMDIDPINSGHILVVPKQHVTYWKDMEESLGGHLFGIGIKVNRALRESGIRCEGITFHAADGAAAGQEVFHAHLHIIPRFRGDGVGLKYGHFSAPLPNREALDKIANLVKAKIA